MSYAPMEIVHKWRHSSCPERNLTYSSPEVNVQ